MFFNHPVSDLVSRIKNGYMAKKATISSPVSSLRENILRRRIYRSADKIPLVKNGLGMVIISTSQGVIADHDARTKKLGGEVLFKIF